MRQLQSGLERDKKLKHGGRLQYGLFLKGAGLSMDEALAFFQRHFTAVTGEQFQKQYSYSIRHMYGKEGKRANYTPYSCSKIIMGTAPSAGDHHGCPYKHYDNDHLSQLLQKLHIGTPQDRATIMSLKKSNNFQLACQKHFEVMHPNASEMSNVSLDNVGNHPNAWFRASVAYHDQRQQATATTTTNEGSTPT
jgi:DNA primase large subunit